MVSPDSASHSASTPGESPVVCSETEDLETAESPKSNLGVRRSNRIPRPKMMFTFDEIGGDPIHR